MSAFCAIVQKDGLNHTTFRQMRDTMAFRGEPTPTQQAPFAGASFGTSHAFTEGRYSIAADVRLKHRERLADALTLPHANDAQLIVAAYDRWGEGCIERLHGVFAFALWDGERLFCGRDRTGARPFYYVQQGDTFACGTLIRPLMAAVGLTPQLNEERLAHLMLKENGDYAAITYFEGVHKLRPAHTLSLSGDTLTTRCYWQLDAHATDTPLSEQEAAIELRRLFKGVVAFHTSDLDVIGSQVSGGLDSSAVTLTAAHQSDKPIHTFTALMPDGTPADERDYINAVLAAGDFHPHLFTSADMDPLYDLDRLLPLLEEPFFNPNSFIFRESLRLAAPHGVKAILTGQDGDTVLSHGYGLFTEWALAQQWVTIRREAQQTHTSLQSFTPGLQTTLLQYAGIAVQSLLQRGRFLEAVRTAHQLAQLERRTTLQILLDKGVKGIGRELLQHMKLYKLPLPEGSLMPAPAFAQRMQIVQRYNQFVLARPLYASERIRHHALMTDPGHTRVMEISDRYTALYGVELRYPFYDAELMAFTLSLPARLKLRDGMTRYLFRVAMEGILPPAVQWRPGKANLSHNAREIFLRYQGERVEALLADPSQPIFAYADRPTLQRQFEAVKASYSEQGMIPLWMALLLNMWLNRTF